MKIGAELAADLNLLTEALNDPDADVAATLAALDATIRAAVSSYLGVAVTAVDGDRSFSFATLPQNADLPPAAASLAIAFPDASTGGNETVDRPLITLTLYAGNPGAFVDLAADLGFMAGGSSSGLVLDSLPPAGPPAHVLTLVQQSAIDQAIGLLIGIGHTPDEASRVIAGRALAGRVERHVAARMILDGLDERDHPAV